MDYVEGSQWLSRARKLDFQIRDKIYVIDALYTCCGLQGISYDRVSVVTTPENKFEKTMAEIDKHKRELESLRQKKEKVIYEILEKLNTLETSPEKTILIGYYVNCERMEKISQDIGYELKYCYRLRKRGIKML